MVIYFLRTYLVHTILAMISILFAGDAQAQVTYRLDTVTMPALATGAEVNGMNNRGVVIGKFYRSPSLHGVGYIYDVPGVLGLPHALYLLPDLLDFAGWPDASVWEGSSVVGINDQGQIVGYLSRTVNGVYQNRGFAMDLSTTPWSWKYLPVPLNATDVYGARINEFGEILGYCVVDGLQFAYLHNIVDAAGQFEMLAIPFGEVITLTGNALDLNNVGQVLGHTSAGVFRLTPGVKLEFLPEEVRRIEAINDFGVVCGNGARPSGRRSTTLTGFRYATQIEYITNSYSAKDINNAGDVAVQMSALGRPYLDHTGTGLLSIDPMMSSQSDLNFWTAASVIANRLNERDATRYPQIAGQATGTTTTGSGKTKVTTSDRRIFILTPELVQ